MFEQLTAAFTAERTQLLAERDQLQAALAAAQQAAQHQPMTPDQQEWQTLQAQLQRAREEREAAIEQVQSLGAQLAMARDEQLSAVPAAGEHALPATDGAPAETGKKGSKGWGDRVKEMKERAEKAKAKIAHR